MIRRVGSPIGGISPHIIDATQLKNISSVLMSLKSLGLLLYNVQLYSTFCEVRAHPFEFNTKNIFLKAEDAVKGGSFWVVVS